MNKERILDTMDEEAYRELQAENKELKARVKQLDDSLAMNLEINEKHQRYNGRLQIRITELEEDNKKLAHQVEDKVDQLRKSGM